MAHDENRPEGDPAFVSPDLTTADLTTADSTPAATSSGLTPEDIAYMQSVQKKRVKFMIVAGIIIMILGFFAGKNLAASRDDSQDVNVPAHSIVVDIQPAHDHWVGAVEVGEAQL